MYQVCWLKEKALSRTLLLSGEREKRDRVPNEIRLWKEIEPEPGWKDEIVQEESSSDCTGREEKWESYGHK